MNATLNSGNGAGGAGRRGDPHADRRHGNRLCGHQTWNHRAADRHAVHRRHCRRAIAARGAAFARLATEMALGLDALVAGEFFKRFASDFPCAQAG